MQKSRWRSLALMWLALCQNKVMVSRVFDVGDVGGNSRVDYTFSNPHCLCRFNGGYAAIKYSKLLGFKRVVALVPQYSIDPEQVTDNRYNMFYQPELNHDMQVQPKDVSTAECEYIVIYDPYCPEDRAHMKNYKRSCRI